VNAYRQVCKIFVSAKNGNKHAPNVIIFAEMHHFFSHFRDSAPSCTK